MFNNWWTCLNWKNYKITYFLGWEFIFPLSRSIQPTSNPPIIREIKGNSYLKKYYYHLIIITAWIFHMFIRNKIRFFNYRIL